MTIIWLDLLWPWPWFDYIFHDNDWFWIIMTSLCLPWRVAVDNDLHLTTQKQCILTLSKRLHVLVTLTRMRLRNRPHTFSVLLIWILKPRFVCPCACTYFLLALSTAVSVFNVVLCWADDGCDCLFNWLPEAPFISSLYVFLCIMMSREAQHI